MRKRVVDQGFAVLVSIFGDVVGVALDIIVIASTRTIQMHGIPLQSHTLRF